MAEAPAPRSGNPADRTGEVIPSGLLTDLFDDAVRRFGERPAIDFLGRKTRYAALGAIVERAARGLQTLGVKPGTRVGLCLPNTPYYPILFFATLRAGGIVVNLSPLYVERELTHLLRDSGAEIVVTCDIAEVHARVLAAAAASSVRIVIVCPIADALPPLKRIAYRLLKRALIARVPRGDPRQLRYVDLLSTGTAFDPPVLEKTDVAVLQYTGGTTGTPKAAMLTHANLTANAEAQRIHLGGEARDQDRVIGVLPLFHVFALTCVLTLSVRIGAEMVLLPRYSLGQLLKTLRRARPTYFPAVPTIFAAIAGAAETERIDLSSIRVCISGGAPLPAEVRQQFEQRTGARVAEGYGLSETSPIIACNAFDAPGKPGSAGRPFPGTALEIRSLDDPTVVLPTGERGEICARGPQVMKGYWNDPAATEAVFVDGALRTGDVGYLDADGDLFIVDRIKDLILCSGYNVYPRTIEDALYEHPAVAEAIVIGVPDAYRGEAPKAFVTLVAGASVTPDALCTFLRERLSRIEQPREIVVRDSLPKTLIGKLSKKALEAEERSRG